MVSHEHPGMATPAVAPANLPEPEKESLAVVIALEDRLPAIAPRHHMIDRPRILVSQRPRHTARIRRFKQRSRKMLKCDT